MPFSIMPLKSKTVIQKPKQPNKAIKLSIITISKQLLHNQNTNKGYTFSMSKGYFFFLFLVSLIS